jgi:heterodisulfide reductase subunit A
MALSGEPLYPGDASPAVLVIGGGVAGILASLDLARAGRSVCLVERAPRPGGQVARLDKIYPTDHCAFCPLWTDVRKCLDHPLVTVMTGARLASLRREGERWLAEILRIPPPIDEGLCIFCGRCVPACGEGAVSPLLDQAYPPAYRIDAGRCTGCGACVSACPTGAIDFSRKDTAHRISAGEVLWATGFGEGDLRPLPEYGYGTHPDIMTSLEFEEWTAESGPNGGKLVRKSDGGAPSRIAFIQCAGARDLRMFPYCSAVCCMHALKQATWLKRRNGDLECTVYYTDLRAVGRDYYGYSKREPGGGVRLVRGRPGLVFPLPGGGIAVKYEDTFLQEVRIERFDLVVLNGNLRPSLSPDREGDSPHVDREGFVDTAVGFGCGFAVEPADIMDSAVQAAAVSMRILGRDKL